MTPPFDPLLAIDAYLDGELPSDQFDRLRSWLEEDPAHAEILAQRASLHSRLSLMYAHQLDVDSEETVSLQKTNAYPLLNLIRRSLPEAIDPVRNRAAFLTAASLLTAVFCGALLLLISSQTQRSPSDGGDQDFVASVTYAEKAVWTEGQTDTQPGSRLLAGHSLELEQGLIHVQFRSDARVVVEGPAKLRCDSPDSMTLHTGRMLAHVSPQAQGFTVETSTIDLVDLGTEFGVEARERETEVQVFEGRVEVRRHGEVSEPARLLAAGNAVVVGISPQTGFTMKEKKMNRAIYLTLAAMLSLGESSTALAVMIPLQNATATHESGIYPQEEAIDGNTTSDNGWAPGATNVDANPLIVFETVSNSSAGTYTFNLIHADTTYTEHTLARFRISATTDDRSTFADGIVGGDVTASWTTLTPSSAISTLSSGATFTIVGDEVQVSGTNPTVDTYQVVAPIPFGDVTGFRIESISSASSPTGPGRAEFRNFILTEFQVSTEPFPSVPEPTSGAILGLGGMLVLGLGRRRQRQIRKLAKSVSI